MTREEEFDKVYGGLCVEMRRLFGKVFDNFESRTCENCRHSTELDTDELACESEYMISEFNTYPQFPLIVYEDFGCNKFEQKDV